jgi:hypothetical protein
MFYFRFGQTTPRKVIEPLVIAAPPSYAGIRGGCDTLETLANAVSEVA